MCDLGTLDLPENAKESSIKYKSKLNFIFIEISKKWLCTKNQNEVTGNKVSKGCKCTIICNDGYKLSESKIYFQNLVSYSDREKYGRRCKTGGIWSQNKAQVACEVNCKIFRLKFCLRN